MTGILSHCILILTLVFAISLKADGAELDEYEIKSGMLYNFINFIEFPPESLGKTMTLNICVAADNFTSRFFHRLQGKQGKNRTIVVMQIIEPERTAGCNMLFIQRSESHQQSEYLQMTQKRPILTVSDMDDFASKGGIIGFIELDGKVRLEINLDAARQSKIKINSQLLKLARIVSSRN